VAAADRQFSLVEGFFRIWDLAKPVIAQVHGYCLAGGTELATACDLVYVAEDARIGYPVVRSISPPDNQFYPWIVGLRRAMELMLTGDHMSGAEAVECGFANRAFAEADLVAHVLDIAERVARTPSDLQQINKRAVHRLSALMTNTIRLNSISPRITTMATIPIIANSTEVVPACRRRLTRWPS
jgi:enoyl-CoA hydratase